MPADCVPVAGLPWTFEQGPASLDGSVFEGIQTQEDQGIWMRASPLSLEWWLLYSNMTGMIPMLSGADGRAMTRTNSG